MRVKAWLNLAAVILIVIIVIVVILVFRLYRPQADNLHDVFGLVTHIRELPQLEDWSGFRTYNPSIFTVGGPKSTANDCYYVYRVCNFALCPGTRNQWNARHRERTVSHTVIQSPSGGLTIIKHPRLEQLFPDQREEEFHGRQNYDGRIGRRNCEQGGEDARPFIIGQKLYLISNATTGYQCRRQMILMQFNLNQLNSSAGTFDRLKDIEPQKIWQLEYDAGVHRDQKNWMPLNIHNELHFVYSVNPHVILKFDKQSGRCHKIASTWNCNLSDELRGGSQIIRVTKWNLRSRSCLNTSPHYKAEELYLGVLHKRDSTFEYMTYIYAFETKHPYRVKYITDSFVFGEYGSHSRRIQFAAGLARVVQNDRAYLYITYGENDCTSKVCVLLEEDVLRSLNRV